MVDIDITKINSIADAKAAEYNGKKLEVGDKKIFDSNLLKVKKTDGTFDGKDVAKIKATAQFLDDYKKAEEVSKKADKKNLEATESALLSKLEAEKATNSIAYQAVNDEGAAKGQVVKVMDALEKILINEDSPDLKAALDASEAKKQQIEKQLKTKKGEHASAVEKLDASRTDRKLATAEKVKIIKAIGKLKVDTKILNILNSMVLRNKETMETVFKADAKPGISVIKTSFPVKSFAHPAFLTDDLPGQIILKIFKDLNKDEFFNCIDNCSDTNLNSVTKKNRAKLLFERILSIK